MQCHRPLLMMIAPALLCGCTSVSSASSPATSTRRPSPAVQRNLGAPATDYVMISAPPNSQAPTPARRDPSAVARAAARAGATVNRPAAQSRSQPRSQAQTRSQPPRRNPQSRTVRSLLHPAAPRRSAYPASDVAELCAQGTAIGMPPELAAMCRSAPHS